LHSRIQMHQDCTKMPRTHSTFGYAKQSGHALILELQAFTKSIQLHRMLDDSLSCAMIIPGHCPCAQVGRTIPHIFTSGYAQVRRLRTSIAKNVLIIFWHTFDCTKPGMYLQKVNTCSKCASSKVVPKNILK
jgi:hypothetical protein